MELIWKLDSIGELNGRIKEWIEDCLDRKEMRIVENRNGKDENGGRFWDWTKHVQMKKEKQSDPSVFPDHKYPEMHKIFV